MSSLAPPPSTITTTAGSGSFSSSSRYSSSLFLRSFKVPIVRNPNHRHAVSCKTLDDHDHHDQDSSKVDRRNVLLGLGGLYGAATTFGSNSSAFADPILAPDVTKCVDADLPDDVEDKKCCPPIPTKIIDFQLPPPIPSTKLRVRWPAHLVKNNHKSVAEFNRAIELMKALPVTDPRNFMQQANVHCAYCDDAYEQVGFPDLKLQVHSSWLFLPFHRCYLYFFEKICGELIGNPDFALPFWNWDTPDGMHIPDIYINKESPLFDSHRDARHRPPTVVNLHYHGNNNFIINSKQVSKNLVTMYQQVCGATTPRLFMGDPFRPGCMPPSGPGSLESVPHNTMHNWTGDTKDNHEDMGIFYSAARDPIFYAHHANVDRMWSIWKTLPGSQRKDFSEKDWLESSFVFYNEKREMVRIKVQDCLDTKKLGYVYQNVAIPWRHSRPRAGPKKMLQANETMAPLAKHVFPATLNKVIKALVQRPKKSRSKEEKDEKVEILVIEGIELKNNIFMKFDVFVNNEDKYEDEDEDEDEEISGTAKREFAGSFVHVPHKHDHGESIKTKLSLDISELLHDLDIESHDNIMVTLVPKAGGDDISIGGIKIDFDY